MNSSFSPGAGRETASPIEASTPVLPRLLQLAMALSLLIGSIALTACATSKSKQTESTLSAAGFRVVSATTPAQQEKLHALKPGQITRISRTNQVYYVYPAVRQNELFVGGAKEYRTYQQLLQGQQIAAEYAQAAQQTQADTEVMQTANLEAGIGPWDLWPAWGWPAWSP